MSTGCMLRINARRSVSPPVAKAPPLHYGGSTPSQRIVTPMMPSGPMAPTIGSSWWRGLR